ncbi:MAG: TonB family protein, partial [Chlorobiales bacterium]|nr:TonB family protein [Chlorobiales bacterium]
VPGANVYISGPVTMANISNARGYYVFISVPQGSYTIKATKRGLPEWKHSFVITSDRVQRQDVRLAPAGSNEKAVVVAKRKTLEPIVQPENRKKETLTETRQMSKPKGALAERKDTQDGISTEEAEPDTTVDEEVLQLASESIADESEQVAIAEALKEAEEAFAAMAVMPETQAEIEGGISSIYDKIVYPEAARRLRIEGKVVAKVYLDSHGRPGQIDFIKPAHDVLNEEVFRVLSEVAQYKPAKVGAKSVASIIVVPVKFSLGN